ncbi:response regulator transcription factor [Shouchella clausii]|jgi:two-component system, NarL family, response regulator DesR|uniref:DNA-binding response regulator n=1 Tax=Shouchella clausii TaxID=79880 RepID=A0A268RZN8_SHOCL|nr:response regulator transcription factor [Shouchella clausii]PAD44257.1 DNA-binding response regulator [Bacillus sp. 7520-S]SPU21261.1 two-component response regulator [Niallia circulans]AST94944.1 DNA-binding response regulator [Shouchella clausii]MBU8596244.1 response regulator transcription factor [Shouchella clausii]MCM3549284.1 response regulator transcription factor [Shouchella clausii]
MIEIVIAEDQQMMLGALGALLDFEADMKVVGKAHNGEEAIKLVKALNPNICIMDIEMPVMDGLDAAYELKDHSCRVMVLTTFAQPGYFERARRAGVEGYLLKDSPSEDLAAAIRTIMDGRRVYAPELIDMVYHNETPLTEREEQVLKLIAEGRTTQQIADELKITNGTVRNYVSVILDKLEVGNRIEAISYYKKKGWLR